MTETATFSLNKGETQNYERQVATVTVGTGELLVSDGQRSETISGGQSFDAAGSPTVGVFAIDHSNFEIVYADNAVAPTVRGDADSDTGSYESRTVDELHDLAKKRGLKGYYDLKKNELIALLRGN